MSESRAEQRRAGSQSLRRLSGQQVSHSLVFGRVLAWLRGQSGDSQLELALAAGLQVAAVGKLELGRQAPLLHIDCLEAVFSGEGMRQAVLPGRGALYRRLVAVWTQLRRDGVELVHTRGQQSLLRPLSKEALDGIVDRALTVATDTDGLGSGAPVPIGRPW